MGVVMDSVSVVAAGGDPFWAEVLEAAKHAPRQIDRLGNLATMRCGTVVVDGDGRAWQLDAWNGWACTSGAYHYPPHDCPSDVNGPLTLVWSP